jgi:hypothetical protein
MRNGSPVAFEVLRRAFDGLLLVATVLLLAACAGVPTKPPVVASPAALASATPGA